MSIDVLDKRGIFFYITFVFINVQKCVFLNYTLEKLMFETHMKNIILYFRPAALSTKEAELPAEYLNSSLAQQVQVIIIINLVNNLFFPNTNMLLGMGHNKKLFI